MSVKCATPINAVPVGSVLGICTVKFSNGWYGGTLPTGNCGLNGPLYKIVPRSSEGGMQARVAQDCTPMTTAISSEPVKVSWKTKQNAGMISKMSEEKQ